MGMWYIFSDNQLRELLAWATGRPALEIAVNLGSSFCDPYKTNGYIAMRDGATGDQWDSVWALNNSQIRRDNE